MYEENMEFMMIELEDLDPQFLCLILDTLEHYELYRLCLVLCNRYNLKDRHGRYIAAICHKYSNLSKFRVTAFEKFKNVMHKEA